MKTWACRTQTFCGPSCKLPFLPIPSFLIHPGTYAMEFTRRRALSTLGSGDHITARQKSWQVLAERRELSSLEEDFTPGSYAQDCECFPCPKASNLLQAWCCVNTPSNWPQTQFPGSRCKEEEEEEEKTHVLLLRKVLSYLISPAHKVQNLVTYQKSSWKALCLWHTTREKWRVRATWPRGMLPKPAETRGSMVCRNSVSQKRQAECR